MFTCWDFIEPIRYGVCDVHVECGVGLLRVIPLFISWFAISLLEIPVCTLTLCIAMLCLVHII
jgi:hypothetical protein